MAATTPPDIGGAEATAYSLPIIGEPTKNKNTPIPTTAAIEIKTVFHCF